MLWWTGGIPKNRGGAGLKGLNPYRDILPMKTYFQTAIFTTADSSLEFATYRLRPVPPEHLQGLSEFTVFQGDGTVLYWYADGCVVEEKPDGSSMTFWPRPTFADALETEESFYQFHTGGAVSSSQYGDNWRWSEDVEGTPVPFISYTTKTTFTTCPVNFELDVCPV